MEILHEGHTINTVEHEQAVKNLVEAADSKEYFSHLHTYLSIPVYSVYKHTEYDPETGKGIKGKHIARLDSIPKSFSIDLNKITSESLKYKLQNTFDFMQLKQAKTCVVEMRNRRLFLRCENVAVGGDQFSTDYRNLVVARLVDGFINYD